MRPLRPLVCTTLACAATVLGVPPLGAAQPGRLANISTRGVTDAGHEALIAGFVISGSAPKQVLIRAAGPALLPHGVHDVLADPRLVLFDADNSPVASNDDWSAADAAIFSSVGAFNFTSGSKDAALVATLSPGSYTVQVTPATAEAAAGVSLVEVYEVSGAARLVNLSTRGRVTPDQPLIAGIVVPAGSPRRVLLRAAGPALIPFGVAGALTDPKITLFATDQTAVAENDNWSASGAAALAAISARCGAFAFVSGSADSALVADLAPGRHTLHVTSATAGGSGIALVEAYDITDLPTETVSLATIRIVSPDMSIAEGTVATFGHVFAPGEIAANQSLLATMGPGSTALPCQLDVKRRHPDGSARHALVSVRLPAVTTTPGTEASLAVSLSAAGTPSGGTDVPLSVDSITASGAPIDLRVEITEHGFKTDGQPTDESGRTWTGTLKSALASCADTWISGPLVSEWRARVAPVSQGAAHPGLRIIFDARYTSTTQARISVALENVESDTGRGDRSYDLRIYDAATGGTLLYGRDNILHHAHTRFRRVFHLGAGMKDLLAIADASALKRARAIPNYAELSIPEASLAAYHTQWQTSPRDLYEFSFLIKGMNNTGGRWDIGPLPGWVALALISGDARAYRIMFDLTERAAYWNIHWRDSLLPATTTATADIFSVVQHPRFCLFNNSYAPDAYVGSAHVNWQGDFLPPPALPLTQPAGSGADTAHQPAFAYLPYAITGDRYFLDELYFWAGWNHISTPWGARDEDKGVFRINTTREMAWSLRTNGHAAWISPDAHWQKDYFTGTLLNNLAWARSHATATNPLGYWIGWSTFNGVDLPYASTEVAEVFAPWQHQFMAYTLHELCERGYDAADLRAFALGFSVRLFTSGSDFDRMDGSAYQLPAKLKDGSTPQTMAALAYHAFTGRSYAERHPNAPTTIEQYNSPGGSAIFAFTTLGAALDAGIGSHAEVSEAFRFLRHEIMRHGPANQRQFVNDPTWNIVPRTPVAGLAGNPAIYDESTAP